MWGNSWWLLLVATVLAEDCGWKCGGCKSGRCDVFGCKGGLFCCVGNIVDPSYGACCTTCTPPLPSKCLSPSGDDCSFYSGCILAFHNCSAIQTVALPKCEEFVQLEPSLSSPSSQSWSAGVRRCLQQQISADVLAKQGTDFTCDAVENAFWDDHPPCYFAPLPFLPYGLCSLPLVDQAEIYWHGVAEVWTTYPWQLTQTGQIVARHCIYVASKIVVRGIGALTNTIWNKITSAYNSALALQGELSLWLADFAWDVLHESQEGTDISACILYQPKNYTGPTTPWPTMNATAQNVGSLLAQVIRNITGGNFTLVSYDTTAL
eukprot:TRINITY_DN11270_c0_g1_i1.p1 TRINITY_DN11270_c0_g1~~TRINITY_DN11270_c0_g1_i1.p1  ORF type:complete len:320 (-),score=30.42 TRINITY_DN11270_c0_g1_i1:78-1037(-)